MPLFRRHSQPDPQLADLSTQVALLRARLDELGRPSPAPSLPPPGVDDLAAPVRRALDELAARLDAAEQAHAADRDRVETRLGELSTTLSDQLHELSGGLEAQDERLAAFRAELEALATDHDDGGPVADLLERQTRIANEVARHEIAFQQELAALADRLTRQRPSR
jgi:hypothetical protein